MNQDLQYQLAITMIPKIGALTARKLISYVGSLEGVFRESPSNLRKIPGIGDLIVRQLTAKNYMSEAEAEILSMEKFNIKSIYYQDSEYPWRLKNCDDGPLLLFYKGNPDFSRLKMLSIVGTRDSTQYGREICDAIISELSVKYPELVIVSGLAYGIDICAHRAALDHGLHTFAVLAHGLNTIYPSEHIQSALKIMNQGALLSDFQTTVKPERNNFLRRNRIIAGLSEATLVVESGLKGGAMITADIASSYSREVFAIPGRIKDTYSCGCNYLIKESIAALVENSSDIEKQLNWETNITNKAPKQLITVPLNTEERKIILALSEDPELGQEILSIRTAIPIHKLMGILLQMELKNWITVLPGNIYRTAVNLS